MGITAAVTSVVGGISASKKAKKAEKKAEAERKRQETEMKKKEAIETAKQEAMRSTMSGTGAGRRIALERSQLARSTGKGRAGSVIRRTGTLG